ncbi:NAD(P)H-binding protein [Actinoplanes solisilvae]|uniref:NAD(P)H-binding protein n=1 Tax=Actinoplanes solisilvae TaxID=2486853 RepID=UPI000FDBDFBC|nr:NAD(P)H-binding protein [Actinoplanes solisilvae]
MTTTLVTGATGNVGRHTVAALARHGHVVRALTRKLGKADLPGAEMVEGDLANPASLAAALDGVEAVQLITFAGEEPLSEPTSAAIVARLRTAGVRRVTVLSGGGVSPLQTAVRGSDLEWTVLAPVEFMSGALDWVDSIRDEGVVRVGFVERRSAMVHDADIGAVGAAVLACGGYGGRELAITGPEVLTPPDMVRIVGEAIGRDVRLVPLTEEQARDQWRAEGFPDEVIEFFVWAHGNTPEIGYTVAPTVEAVTGRPARTFAEWARENADRFR